MSGKGPVLVIASHRGRVARLEKLLAAERFEVLVAGDGRAALAGPMEQAPTVVLIDWSLEDEVSREELVYRLRPRRVGPRVVAIAPPEEAQSVARVTGVSDVIGDGLDAEEVIDVVWRCHHEVQFAREG